MLFVRETHDWIHLGNLRLGAQGGGYGANKITEMLKKTGLF